MSFDRFHLNCLFSTFCSVNHPLSGSSR